MNISSRINSISGLQIFQVIRFSGIFLTSVILAKSGVEMQIIGNYEKLLLVAGAASFFWVQGILSSLLANYYDQKSKEVYLFNAFILISLISVLVYGLMQLFSIQVQHLFSLTHPPGYKLISLYILFNAPCFLIETIFLLKKAAKSLIVYGIVSAVVSMLAVVLPLINGYSIETALSLLVLWAIVRFFLLLRLLLKNSVPDFQISYLKDNLHLAWPLIISYLIGGSADYIDGLMATHFFGPESFAVFRYGAKELPVSLLLANALSMSIIPILNETKEGHLNLEALKTHSLRLMHFIFPISIILIFSSKWLYPIIFDQRFAGSASIFNIYLLLTASRMIFPQSIILALKKNKTILAISSIEIIINVVSSYLLMLKLGIIGIAWGTVIAYSCEKLMLCLYLYFSREIKIKDYIPVTIWLIYFSLLSISYLIVYE